MKNIKAYHFQELIKKSYSLDHIFLLKLINDGYDVSPLCEDSVKIEGLVQSLFRKELITEDRKTVTTFGKELLVFIDTKEPSKIVKKKKDSTEFELWWKTYPGTDTFSHNGRTFQGSRSLRQNKEACQTKFEQILLEGKYTVDDLIRALEVDVNQKKDNSVRLGQNKLTYMQNSLTYLNQRSFEPFIELIKEFKEEPKKPGGSVDI